jgi:small basic protein
VLDTGKDGAIHGWLAAAMLAVGTYLALLFVLVLPRLYSAYVSINKVRDRLNGFSRGRV